jgi:bifunctional enzyme CysN/CysC
MFATETLDAYRNKDLLRLLTAGSVDDGKSTLIGRLLFDSKLVFEDHLTKLESDSKRVGSAGDRVDYSLLLDGLKAEREQGITIDVAYRYFATPRRKFIIADTPGHEQYTRNMATGASTADLALLLVDARQGVVDQTRRHSFIASLLGIKHLVVAVNKMDLVDFEQAAFEKVRRDFAEFSARLSVTDVHFFPISALEGDNVVARSDRTPWFDGSSLLHHLENVHIAADRNLIDFRMPVQYVLRQQGDFRGFCGTVASGVLRQDAEVVVLPSRRRTRVKAIRTFDGDLEEAFAPQAVTVELADEVDVSRGDVLAYPGNVPLYERDLEAMLVWMAEEPFTPGKRYQMKQATSSVTVEAANLRYRSNVNSLHREEATELGLNEIGRVHLVASRPLCYDAYRKNRAMGAFVLVDLQTNGTVGAGMLLARRAEAAAGEEPDRRAEVRRQRGQVSLDDRCERLGQRPATLWFTGLPCAGKTSLAYGLERRLFEAGFQAHVLDGENLRSGISDDLDFSAHDRTEHARRAAHVARVTNEVGLITIVALVSPNRYDREEARRIVGEDRFLEVFVDAPVEVCEGRDDGSLYARARAGEIPLFSGVTAPYEAPTTPALHLATDRLSIEDSLDQLWALLVERGAIT